MRVLIVHNAYQQRGGEDVVVDEELRLLRDAGNVVSTYLVNNDSIDGPLSRASAAWKSKYDARQGLAISEVIRDFAPDVVHIHNFFPILTPAIHVAAREMAVPVVQTLHNFRITCASALLLRNGQICEKCVHGSAFWGAYHRCYRNSLVGSLAVARMIDFARREHIWSENVDRFVALTEFSRQKFIEAGLPPERIAVKPNFLQKPAPIEAKHCPQRRGLLFVGRLSREKGVELLIRAMEQVPDQSLRIAGDGPEFERLTLIAGKNVTLLGALTATEVRNEMLCAEALVMPSQWYEGFPITLLEAFANALPVIATKIGSLAELIDNDRTGLLVEAGDVESLAAAMRRVTSDRDAARGLGKRAYATFLERYTPSVNLAKLLEIYDEARRQSSLG
ncbi:glycosyltransferase family 1 protein [Sphingomonas koreensis]|nr:glycosyltransferase family 1 protein [Sphingomonas koreensis]